MLNQKDKTQRGILIMKKCIPRTSNRIMIHPHDKSGVEGAECTPCG